MTKMVLHCKCLLHLASFLNIFKVIPQNTKVSYTILDTSNVYIAVSPVDVSLRQIQHDSNYSFVFLQSLEVPLPVLQPVSMQAWRNTQGLTINPRLSPLREFIWQDSVSPSRADPDQFRPVFLWGLRLSSHCFQALCRVQAAHTEPVEFGETLLWFKLNKKLCSCVHRVPVVQYYKMCISTLDKSIEVTRKREQPCITMLCWYLENNLQRKLWREPFIRSHTHDSNVGRASRGLCHVV